MTEPYLSVVVTARNDDHGGNLMGRMQAFVNGWLKQAARYDLASELIIVEWNPPEGRPGLKDAIQWPRDPGLCSVRIIEVPPELHRRYGHAAALPLYQMIGKNVGIRRARGKFVLATNIDILFSSELMRFFAERRLEEGRMYRIDRHDVMSDVPIDAAPEEQQAYCDSHIIRLNRREGTFPSIAAPEVKRAEGGAVRETTTLEALPPGLRCGNGWFPLEKHSYGATFRWAGRAADIDVTGAPPNSPGIVFDVEPGPGNPADGLDLEITVDGKTAGRFSIQGRSKVTLRADWSRARRIGFLAHNEIAPLGNDPRTLAFRILDTKWLGDGKTPVVPAATLRPGGMLKRLGTLWTGLNHLIARMEADAPVATFSVLVSPALRRLLRTYMKLMSIGRLGASTPGAPVKRRPPLAPPAMLHTNACGDFTLAARRHWLDLRGYAEFDLYSMNLDSLFCYAAHHAGVKEEMLQDPMRIYHIEHGTGSGWTPEGQEKLYARLEAAGLSFVEMDTVLAWGAHMQLLDSPMIFNRENWGLGDCDLPETTPLESRQ